jgi:hypothetical protein
MKVLYLTAPSSDYLADSVLHGLRALLGEAVVDFPRCDVLYRDDRSLTARAHGRGFTLYGLLDDVPVDRYDVLAKVRSGFYDLVVISSIHRQFGWFLQLLPWLRRDRTIVIDGEDGDALYPYAGTYWRETAHRFLPRAHTRFLYFKREWTPATLRYRWFTIAPGWLARRLPAPRNLRPIAFSIPAEKIVAAAPAKSKEFPRHVVDPEIAAHLPESTTGYAFDTEAAYYADLQASRWGITTKRAGWECIRHYEIAANGAVPCFRDLDRKPATCAPHGLDAYNAVTYRDWGDLQARVRHIDASGYHELQERAITWARRNTTEVRAREILDALRRAS